MEMKKVKFKLEYPLSVTSPNAIWNAVGTASGLSEWFADIVDEDHDQLTFHWEKFMQSARILHLKSNSYIRLQWEEDSDTEYFFEMKITSSELSKEWTLFVTDFSEPGEKEDSILLWNQQIDNLKRFLGL